MAISSKIEEVVYEVTKVAGNIYDSLQESIGSVTTPATAIYEINNLYNMANSGNPYFAILDTTPAGFATTYSPDEPYYVNVASGQVVYDNNVINVFSQDISIRRSFSQLYSNLYVYGMTIGLPLDEVQKAVQNWNTETTTAAAINDSIIYIADTTIPETLGFPLEAQVGRLYIKFVSLNSDKTGMVIDPGQNLGTLSSPVYGKIQSSIPAGSSVRFNYQARVQSVMGFPILTNDGTADPDTFEYYPPIPPTWLSIANVVITNPSDPSVVDNSGEYAIVKTTTPLPYNNETNPIFGDGVDNSRILAACENALNDMENLRSSFLLSEVVQGIKSLSIKLSNGSNTNLRKIWAAQPFRVQSYFSKGLSFSGLERFNFPYNFAQAYYELTSEDLQHTFAIFRGDLVSNNPRLVGTAGVDSGYTATSLTAPGSLSSLERGTHIYGASVVKSITSETSGETVPSYIDVTTNSVSNNNYMIELTWQNVTNALFYNVYKRGNLASDLMEYRLTIPDEVQKQPYFSNSTIADDSNVQLSSRYTAIKIEPDNDGFCGGISVKLLYGTEGYLVKNTSDYLTLRLYDSFADYVTSGDTDATLDDTNTLYVPNIESPLTDEVKLYYNDLSDQSDEYTFKFKKGVNLVSGHIYWAIIDRPTLIEVIDPETNITSTGSIFIRGLEKDIVDPYGEITLWKSSTLTTGFENWSTYDNVPSSFYNIYTPYYKLRGYLDNGLGVKYPVRRGLKFYDTTSFTPRRLSIYVPPVEDIYQVVSESFAAEYDGLSTETTETKNEMIVTVTARNGASGTPFTFNQTIPQGTERNTRFILGTANDLFDRVDDVYVTPGANLQRTNNGPIKWSIYDFFTVETVP